MSLHLVCWKVLGLGMTSNTFEHDMEISDHTFFKKDMIWEFRIIHIHFSISFEFIKASYKYIFFSLMFFSVIKPSINSSSSPTDKLNKQTVSLSLPKGRGAKLTEKKHILPHPFSFLWFFLKISLHPITFLN